MAAGRSAASPVAAGAGSSAPRRTATPSSSASSRTQGIVGALRRAPPCRRGTPTTRPTAPVRLRRATSKRAGSARRSTTAPPTTCISPVTAPVYEGQWEDRAARHTGGNTAAGAAVSANGPIASVPAAPPPWHVPPSSTTFEKQAYEQRPPHVHGVPGHLPHPWPWPSSRWPWAGSASVSRSSP